VSGILGTTANPREIFTTGFSLAVAESSGGQWGLPTEAQMAASDSAIVAAWTGVGFGIASSALITEIRYSAINGEGKVALNDAGAYMQVKRPRNFDFGGGGTPVHPFQVATVLTLETARSGATGRGRMFLPAPAATVGAFGQVTAASADATAAASKTLLDNVNAAMRNGAPAVPMRVCVASAGSIKQGQVPHNTPVTGVRVGLVLDTIRTRRNRLREDYRRSALL